MRRGRKSAAQTKAPPKDVIRGSKINKIGSASSKSSAKSIELSDEIISSLRDKVAEFNEKNEKNKVSLNTLKAVFRRGAGAFSVSHRPNMTRNGWAYARVNKFLEKKGGKAVKKAYIQDDDLLEDGGELGQNIKCVNCGWQWNTKDSQEFDKYVCHKCGFDNSLFYSNDIMVKRGKLLIDDNGLMDSIYPEISKLFKDNGLKLYDNYSFTDGSNRTYLPHTGMQKNNGNVEKIAITYYENGYEVLGEIEVEIEDDGSIEVEVEFPNWQVKEETRIYARGGQIDKLHYKLKEDLLSSSFKSHKDIEQIAQEKGVDLDYAQEQLRKGMKVESEHSNDPMVQEIIALQHLDEMIDYYEKLEYVEGQKMEDGGILGNTYIEIKYPFDDNRKTYHLMNDIKVKSDSRIAKDELLVISDNLEEVVKKDDWDRLLKEKYIDTFPSIGLYKYITLNDDEKKEWHWRAIKNHFSFTQPKNWKVIQGKVSEDPLGLGYNKMEKGGQIDPDNKKTKEMITHKAGSAGGLLVGNRHSEGGIKAINKSTNTPLEMEGGEVVITRNAVSDDQKREFEGEMLTNREILSKINESGGGVSFEEGGTVDYDCECDDKMEQGGETSYQVKGLKEPIQNLINYMIENEIQLKIIKLKSDIGLKQFMDDVKPAVDKKILKVKLNPIDKNEVRISLGINAQKLLYDKMADGGELDWGADLGDGFSVGNDVYIADTHSRFYDRTGYVVGKLGQSLVIRVGDDEMDAVVNKKYVQRLEAPEFAKGGNVGGDVTDKELKDLVERLSKKEDLDKREEYALEKAKYMLNIRNKAKKYDNGGSLDAHSELKQFFQEQNTPIVVEEPVVEEIIEEEVVEVPTEIMLFREELTTDEDAPMIYVGSSIYANNPNGTDEWIVKSFTQDGINLTHIPISPLSHKHDEKHLSFEDLKTLFNNKSISIKFVLNERELNLILMILKDKLQKSNSYKDGGLIFVDKEGKNDEEIMESQFGNKQF